LVHVGREDASRFLVVGVLFREGQPNATLGDLITAVPGHAGERVDRDTRINATTFFQPGDGYFHYDGSLTTPPYSETVTWLVLDAIHEAGPEQIESINHIEGNNARHIQDTGARTVDHAH
jgi:carbonic anhydrase